MRKVSCFLGILLHGLSWYRGLWSAGFWAPIYTQKGEGMLLSNVGATCTGLYDIPPNGPAGKEPSWKKKKEKTKRIFHLSDVRICTGFMNINFHSEDRTLVTRATLSYRVLLTCSSIILLCIQFHNLIFWYISLLSWLCDIRFLKKY